MSLQQLLERTSRSFYLSLRILPAATRWTVGLAYLLARAADSIADTELLPAQARAQLLTDYLPAMDDEGRAVYLQQLAAQLTTRATNPDEQQLLASLDQVFAETDRLAPSDRPLVRHVIRVITEGMRLDLSWFPPGQLTALASMQQLDRYCYQVAGVVGEFWTRLHAQHFHDIDPELTSLGINYGKGLQRINILRDIPRDLANGRCYLPLDRLTLIELTPEDLLRPDSYGRLAPLYRDLIAQTRLLLADGRRYLRRIPRRRPGLHLASRWPLEIGLATLAALERNNPLDPGRVIKIPRRQVYGILAGSLVRATLEEQERNGRARLPPSRGRNPVS